MLIKKMSINNVLSFETQTIHLDGAPFLTAIGPNGSGKSNFIEILSKVIERVIVVPIKIEDNELWNRRVNPENKGPLRQFIAEHPIWNQQLGELEPNVNIASGILSQVEVSVSLSESELDIVRWVADNAEAIREVVRISGPHGALNDLASLLHCQTYNFGALVTFSCSRTELSWKVGYENSFSGFFIRWFKMLRWLSQMSSEYPELASLKWPVLGELIVVLGAHRSYHSFSNQFTTLRSAFGDYASIADRSAERSTKQIHGDEPAAFDLFRRDVCRLIGEIAYEKGMRAAIVDVLETPSVRRINQRLSEFLDLELSFSAPIARDSTVRFIFKRKSQELLVYRLSSGEKALLHLIFSVYWSGSKNVLALIDEPELHLHPQFHRSFVAILRAAVSDLGWQIIVATHSPGFLCEDFPGSLMCFRRVGGGTSVHTPRLAAEDKELIRLVDYDNSARILFARKVVLVEGSTDAFFFSHFLRALATADGISLTKVDEISFFAILGKGERDKWTSFLRKLDIIVFAISDLDAVLQVNPALAIPIKDRKTQQNINNTVKGKGSRDGLELYSAAHRLAKDVQNGTASTVLADQVLQVCQRIAVRKTDAHAIKELAGRDLSYRQTLRAALDQALLDDHMILNAGELEDYIGRATKGFDVVTEFCRTEFDSWYRDTANASSVLEMQTYMRRILQ